MNAQRLSILSWLSRVAVIAFVALIPAWAAAADQQARETEANVPVEMEVRASRTYADPFNEVTLDVVFTDPSGAKLKVPAFWAGGNVWKVRYSSRVTGEHKFQSDQTANAGDAALHDFAGTVVVKPYSGKNPLYLRGALKVAEDKRHFAYGDGSPFFWLGDTWWMSLTKRLAWPEDVHVLAADRVQKGFTVVQIVAGLYPDMPAFDERGANEAGFPWEKDYARIRPEYFDAADRRMRYIADQGLVPCVVGAWGYHLPWLGKEKMKQHWRYIIARWGALPVVWCAAGETTMPFYLSKTPKEDSVRQRQEWTEVIKYLRETDPWHRIVTTHPSQTARASVTDPAVLDFDMQQSGHGTPAPQQAALAFAGWNTQPVMPVLSGESRYEALEIRPTLTAADARMAFWAHLINSGCAGHTYGANGIWQVNGKSQPYGNSPAGNNWGTTPWNKAMELPGSGQVGSAAKLISSLPRWHQLAPHPDWVARVAEPDKPLAFTGASWIWYPEGEPGKDAPSAARYFYKNFPVPKLPPVFLSRLAVSADDYCEVWLNGERLGECTGWNKPFHLSVTDKLRRDGENILAIKAENRSPDIHPNPAGLIVRLEIVVDDKTRTDIVSDASWRSAQQPHNDWPRRLPDGSAWAAAKVLGIYGTAPWGHLSSPDTNPLPLCAAVNDLLRLIYFQTSTTIKAKHLPVTAVYDAAWFDAVTGTRTSAVTMRPDENGEVTVTPPSGGEDWLLILQRVP